MRKKKIRCQEIQTKKKWPNLKYIKYEKHQKKYKQLKSITAKILLKNIKKTKIRWFISSKVLLINKKCLTL